MILRPKRFWGHPDDWSDEAWDEYLRICESRKLGDRIRRFLWNMSG